MVEKAPQTHNIKHGWIQFNKRKTGELYFTVKVWTDVNHSKLVEVIKKRCKNQQILDSLLSCETIVDVHKIPLQENVQN